MVILGWILDKPLPLLFDPFESIVRFYNPLDGLVLMMYAKVLYISGKGALFGCATGYSLQPHCSQRHDQRCRRWKVQLAGRRDTHMSVFILSFVCGFSTATYMGFDGQVFTLI